MRTYELVRLHFRTPVHFGDAAEGGGLDNVLLFCHADTVFSALCREAAAIDEILLDKLVNAVQKGDLLFSDMLPWYQENENDECEFYLPRPILTVENNEMTEELSLAETKTSTSERKRLKKRAFIRASEVQTYINGMKQNRMALSVEPKFGEFSVETHFNSRTGKPYTTSSFRFSLQAGLYIIVSLSHEKDGEWLERLLKMVGLSGIGGRRSSGKGKFEWVDEPILLDDYEVMGIDDHTLFQMLNDDEAPLQMGLCSVLPNGKAEIEMAYDGTGKLIRRGGFAFSNGMQTPTRTNGVYMMTSGSCFPKRLAGRIADVNQADNELALEHPVYKYGKGLYVGLTI